MVSLQFSLLYSIKFSPSTLLFPFYLDIWLFNFVSSVPLNNPLHFFFPLSLSVFLSLTHSFSSSLALSLFLLLFLTIFIILFIYLISLSYNLSLPHFQTPSLTLLFSLSLSRSLPVSLSTRLPFSTSYSHSPIFSLSLLLLPYPHPHTYTHTHCLTSLPPSRTQFFPSGSFYYRLWSPVNCNHDGISSPSRRHEFFSPGF